MSTEGGTKAVVAALTANMSIAVAKFAAWALTGGAASSMLAEGIHSLADSGNQVLLLVGGKRAKKVADEDHPFGYGRERYVFGFMVAVVLFSLGGLFALYEAYHKWHEIQEGQGNALLESSWWWLPIVVLVFAIVAEGFSFRTAVNESNRARGTTSWVKFIRNAKAPELPVILLEDFAALIGLVLALAGVGLTLITGNGLFDVFGTAAIGLLLVAVAFVLAVETKSLLLGESATADHVAKIRAAIEASEGVDKVIHLKTLHIGPEEILVAAKIAVGPEDTAVAVAKCINDTEQAIREAVPEVGPLYLEPDIYNANYTPRPRPQSPHEAEH